MDSDLLLPRIKEALTERGHSEEDIKSMSPQTIFNEVCEWEGMIGWGPVLWGWVDNIKIAAADGEKDPETHCP